MLCPSLCEVEKVRGTKEYKTKFETWSGVKELTFIIPRNLNNIQQKSGNKAAQNVNKDRNENMIGV